jgi:MATE family multidrug resistance protein
LRGLQDAKTATRINLLAMWCISLPISAAVVFIDHGGPISLRIGFLSGFLVAMIVLAMHLSQKLASTGQTSIAVGHIDVSAEKPAMQ